MLQFKTFVVNPLGVNCYIAHDEQTREAVIIDPGMFFERECEDIQQYIDKNCLHIAQILLTHGHFDHAMSAPWAAETLGGADTGGQADIRLHAADWPLLQHIDEQIRQFLHRNIPVAPPVSIKPVADGDTIQIGNMELQVIHTPGHTPGGVCYYCQQAQTLFSGDSLFQGSIGRTDLDGGDGAALIDSLHKRIMTLPETTRVLPGHGPATAIADELRYNPFL